MRSARINWYTDGVRNAAREKATFAKGIPRAAVSEYHRLTNYLNAARGILTEPERKLLLDFADLAKRK
jgi:hypothetical protein